VSTTVQPDASWYEIDPAFYAHGGVCFSEAESLALADCAGQKALVMPAAGGEEALSLANLGAAVSVLDTAADAAKATALVTASGKPVRFLERRAAEGDLPGGPYDIVYSGFGTLKPIEFFDVWAEQVAAALRPGGRLVIHDAHPMATVPGVYKGIFAIAHSYFGDDEHGHGSSWTMGDLISALGSAGLATIHLEESPDSERYETPLDRFRNVRWDVRWRLPGSFVLVAFKA
jgi:SAM-dependent methyltransferase